MSEQTSKAGRGMVAVQSAAARSASAQSAAPQTPEFAPSAVPLATRHVMQANKSENTKPELRVRAALREAGLPGYRLHWKAAAGKPDVCYPGRKIAIFVNGCFWHRCPYCTPSTPKTNAEFWQRKFARNRDRDRRDRETLVSDGWLVLVVWECRLKRGRAAATMRELVREIRAATERPAFMWPRRGGSVIEVGSRPSWSRRKFAQRLRKRHSGR